MRRSILPVIALSICINIANADSPRTKRYYKAKDNITLSKYGEKQVSIWGPSLNGVKHEYNVPLKALEQCPDWRLAEAPPLTVKMAIEKALTQGKKQIPRLNQKHITGIQLVHFKRRIKDVKPTWYYRIDLDYKIARRSKHCGYIVVLMDGTVVEPVVLPKKKESKVVYGKKPANKDQKMQVSIALDATPVRDAIILFERVMNIKCNVDPAVKGYVTCEVDKKLNVEEQWNLFAKLLKSSGNKIMKENDKILIVPLKEK